MDNKKSLFCITLQNKDSLTKKLYPLDIYNIAQYSIYVNSIFIYFKYFLPLCIIKNSKERFRMLIDQFKEIKDFAFLPERALVSFRILSGNTKSTQYELLQIINSLYKKAASEIEQAQIIYKNGNVVVSDLKSADHIYMTVDVLSKEDGSAVVFIFVPNKNENRQPWEMQGAISANEFHSDIFVEVGNKPREMLFNYAQWNNYLADLKQLKDELALYENWSFKENPSDDDFPILKSYINYTFAKAWQDKLILLSIDGRYSVFNTGLVNRNYQYIYILFEKNIGLKPWKFVMFCIPGIKHGGRLLADNFNRLPKPVRYFSKISDISYIISEEKTPDEQVPDLQPDHYFIDHPDRLPHCFLVDGCRKSSKLTELLNIDINNFTEKEKKEYWHKIGDEITSDPDVYDDLESAFRSAVRKTVMRVSWNYRTAIPVYFPSYNKMSILLPLAFNTKRIAEVALVVEYNSTSKKYTAPTILTLPVAYSNARLVCKPESDWLNQRIFEAAELEGLDINENDNS